MPTLDQLIEQSIRQMLEGGPQGLEDKLYATAEQDINRQSGDTARNILENTFGRGMGNSSITRDLNSDRERVRAEAMIRARSESAMAGRQAILAALAQGVGQQRTRQQSAQFGQSLDMQKRGLKQSQNNADNALLAQGIGGLGASALQTGGLIYGKEIRDLMRGGGGTGPGMSRTSGQLGGDMGSAATAPSLDALASSGGVPEFDMGGYDVGVPDFDLGSYDFGGAGGGGDYGGDLGLGWDLPIDFDLGSTLDLLARYPDFDTGGF